MHPGRLAQTPSPPLVEGAVLRLLGPAPVEVDGRNLADVLGELYPLITRFAVEEAMREALERRLRRYVPLREASHGAICSRGSCRWATRSMKGTASSGVARKV